MTDLRTFEEIGPDDVEAVGGKGLSLGRMARAGQGPVCAVPEYHDRLLLGLHSC